MVFIINEHENDLLDDKSDEKNESTVFKKVSLVCTVGIVILISSVIVSGLICLLLASWKPSTIEFCRSPQAYLKLFLSVTFILTVIVSFALCDIQIKLIIVIVSLSFGAIYFLIRYGVPVLF